MTPPNAMNAFETHYLKQTGKDSSLAKFQSREKCRLVYLYSETEAAWQAFKAGIEYSKSQRG